MTTEMDQYLLLKQLINKLQTEIPTLDKYEMLIVFINKIIETLISHYKTNYSLVLRLEYNKQINWWKKQYVDYLEYKSVILNGLAFILIVLEKYDTPNILKYCYLLLINILTNKDSMTVTQLHQVVIKKLKIIDIDIDIDIEIVSASKNPNYTLPPKISYKYRPYPIHFENVDTEKPEYLPPPINKKKDNKILPNYKDNPIYVKKKLTSKNKHLRFFGTDTHFFLAILNRILTIDRYDTKKIEEFLTSVQSSDLQITSESPEILKSYLLRDNMPNDDINDWILFKIEHTNTMQLDDKTEYSVSKFRIDSKIALMYKWLNNVDNKPKLPKKELLFPPIIKLKILYISL